MARKIAVAIFDIPTAIDEIERPTSGKTFAEFQTDWILARAVERGIEIISEASRRIPKALQDKRPEIPWRDVATIGNILRHEYRSISPAIVWQAVRRDLPPLKAAVRAIHAEIDDD